MELERVVASLVERVERRFLGKYRGIVVDNQDPWQLGRLKVRVPSVLSGDVVTGWAMPCVPYGGSADQGFLFIPEVGAGVWVEFQGGDLEFPIWVGTFWSKPDSANEVPKPNHADGSEDDSVQDPPTRKIIKTLKGHTLQFEDADGSEMITLIDGTNGHVVILDANGIKVTDGMNNHVITLGATGIELDDGKNSGNKISLTSAGVTVADKNGNSVVLGPSGIQVGSSGAAESLVLGTTLRVNVANFRESLNFHTHLGNLGAPTSPPVAQMMLEVPLSLKHTTE